MAKQTKLSVSIGVFAHNEGQNIQQILNSILQQQLQQVQIKEIIVVSSGSYDRTNEIIRKFEHQDQRIQLLEQFKREGKTAAINLFMKHAKSEILVSASADLRLHKQAIEQICIPFVDQNIGMVGAHPIPLNTQHNPIGKQVKLLWLLHHLISLTQPKCGEMIAFRKVINAMPGQSALDEATLEILIQILGYKLAYAPKAIVFNRGPKSIKEFITQHRRNYVGHLWIKNNYHYKVSTLDSSVIIKLIRDYLSKHPQDLIPMAKLISMEFVSRALGFIDFYVYRKNPYIWTMIER